MGAGLIKGAAVAVAALGMAVAPSGAAFAGVGEGTWKGCPVNWWAGPGANETLITGRGVDLAWKCSSISAANVYRKADGSVFRTVYSTDSDTSDGFAAWAKPIPAGSTWLNAQFRVCGVPSWLVGCSTFTKT